MESERSSCGCSSSEPDFSFAFNDHKFSDRVLQIEIMTDPVYWARRRREIGGEAANNNDSNWTMDCSADTVVKVKTLHISSPILAIKSPFFYKLFSNGMSESEQRHVTLKINASEEAALMELLNFMYSNTLNITAPPALVDVLLAADKFEVSSCIAYCSRLLQNSPMTPNYALLYLELPQHLLMDDAVRPLIDAAKQYLAGRYNDITKFKEELLALPLSGIEAVLASDDLLVPSEDALCELVVKWARQHYKRPEERQEVLGTRLARLLHFPCMTRKMLRKVLDCIDFNHKEASKLVLEALFSKMEAKEESASLNHHGRPVKVV